VLQYFVLWILYIRPMIPSSIRPIILQASHIRNMVLGQGMALALIGMIIGVSGSLWLTRFLASFLFGVKAWDPLAFIVTPLLLGAVALAATWIPARRATRVDPMTTLRLE
jgi:ABC-type antimicrobial peptide transport system permease subunit